MKKILVLGASGGIGGAIAEKLRKDGYLVSSPTRSRVDLESEESAAAFFKAEGKDFYGVVHSAGVNVPKTFENVSGEDVDRIMKANTTGFLALLRHVVPGMKERKEGSIVAISSLYGSFARAGRLPYVMSKHALNGLVKTLALEFGPYNIKVNTVSPGFVDTRMTRVNNDAAAIKSFEEKIPLGRLARPEDVAYAVSMLISPDNGYITGQDIIVDGGYSTGGFQK